MDEGETVIPRRGRSAGLGTGTTNGNGSFSRDAVLREAIKLGVSPEDRARLETLARFAYATPGFRAVTPISLGEDRGRHAVFEVLYTPEGPTARPLDPTAPDTPLPVRGDRAVSTANGSAEAAAPAQADDDESSRPDESELRTVLAAAASHSPDLMGAFGATGRTMMWANDSLRAELGVPAWAEPPLVELLDDSSQGQFVVRVLPSLLSRGSWQGQLTLVGPDVEPIPSAVTIVAHHQADSGGHVLVMTAQPTRKPPPARRMRGADEHFEALVEHVSDLIAVIEPGGRVRYASPAASTMLGLEPGEVAGTPFMQLVHPDDVVDDVARLVRVDPEDGTGLPVALRLRSAEGGWRSIEAVVTDLTDNSAIKGYVLNGRDTTERVQANEMLSKLAYTDPDTGLPNRLRLLDRMTTMLESSTGRRSVSAIVIDLDDFRAVNESHGPRVGDALLSEIARRLVEAAGPDAVVGRLRSVEFAVAMPDVDDVNVAERAAESLRVIVARAFITEGHSARVTASIGVSVGTPASHADELLRHASRAAGEAKRSGGNSVVVWGEETARRENRRRAVEQRLHRVLTEGELRVDYQPIVVVDSCELIAAEALLRVRDREDELLNPAEFV
ncbi:MAG TPA: diguanylate cyclase, partial [Acidimicrobiales bacterium]|nr:diguanylate cyclase [Acidimicrobiales bacterium]